MNGWLSVINWPKYQDIRVDEPYYVKLHICVLDDKKVQALDPHPRLLWYQLLPLAGRYRNQVPYNVSAIAKETRLERHTTAKSLQTLISARLVRVTDEPVEVGKKPPRPTGWAEKRGTHGATFVRDPLGTARPPREFFESMKGHK